MAQAGWYDDPDGTPGRLRYFNGAQWTQDTMPHPASDGHTATLPVVPPDAAGPGSAVGAGTPLAGPASGTAASGAPAQGLPAEGTSQDASPQAHYNPAVPYGQAASPSAPYASSPYAQHGYGQQPPQAGYGAAGAYGVPPTPPKRNRAVPIIVAAVVLLVLVAVVWSLTTILRAPVGAPTQRPSATPTAPMVTVPGASVDPTMPQSSPDVLPSPTDCPTSDRTSLVEGAITVTVPSTWDKVSTARAAWADCASAASRAITDDWSTGALLASRADDSLSAREVAEGVWEWNAQANYEASGSPIRVTGTKITQQGPVTVGNLEGYKITGRVTITGLGSIAGDDVAVLDLVDDRGVHSVVVTTSTINDAQSASEVAAVWSSLKVA